MIPTQREVHDCPACELCPCCSGGIGFPKLYVVVIEGSGRARPLCRLCEGAGYVCDVLTGEPSVAEFLTASS